MGLRNLLITMLGGPDESILESYKRENDRLNKELKESQHYITELQNNKYHNQDDAVSVDFKAMGAFSIERLWRVLDGKVRPSTIIGYVHPEATTHEVKEWYLYVSEDRHAELVTEFETVKGERE